MFEIHPEDPFWITQKRSIAKYLRDAAVEMREALPDLDAVQTWVTTAQEIHAGALELEALALEERCKQ